MKIEKLTTHYSGNVAANYEAERNDRKWATEQQIVPEILSRLAAGSHILDAPVGTGRFIPAYQSLGFSAVGLDISEDMLAESRKKLSRPDAPVELRTGDIRATGFPGDNFDCIVCMRFLNWVHTPMLTDVLAELRRVSRKNLIVGIRYLVPVEEIGFASPRQMWRSAHQLKRYIYRRSELIVHRKKTVMDLFDKLGLRIAEAHMVEKDKRGTDYFIYLLEKK